MPHKKTMTYKRYIKLDIEVAAICGKGPAGHCVPARLFFHLSTTGGLSTRNF